MKYFAVLLVALVGCSLPILTPPKGPGTAYPCGYTDVVCGNGYCCPQNHVCCDGTNCTAGYCEFVGEE